MSNFTSIPSQFSNIMKTAVEAESFVYDNPTVAGLYTRQTLETWVHWIYENEPSLRLPYDTSINSLMKEPAFVELFNPEVMNFMHTIRTLGNKAVHNVNKPKITIQEAIHGLKLLHGVSYYFINLYGEDYIKTPVFYEEQIPLAQSIQKKIQDDLIKNLQEQLKQKTELEKQLEEVQKQVEENRKNTQPNVAPPVDSNEALTRAIYIDGLLEEVGWDLSKPNVKEFPIAGMPNNSEEGFADYVLWGDNGKPLAVVEAKKTSRDLAVGRHQAELYAKNLEKQFGQLPNIFLTNGYHIHFYDWEYPIREVQGYYSKDELELNIQRRTSRLSLGEATINPEITDRHYQIGAIKAVAERLEKGHRGALLVMATGTGKTRTAASLIDVLSKANWVKRVLFLADRTALVTQAKNNLNDYLPNLPAVNLVNEKEDVGSRLVFSTYQTLINLIDEAKSEDGRFYGVGHFDLIIFDEIHRSVYNKYKAIFNYFDGFKVGLTATPKETITEANTYELFGLPAGNPTYNYDLDKAVEDGYLVPFVSYEVETKFRRDGIKYADLTDEEKAEYEEKFGDPITGEFPDEIEASALDQWIYNEDTVDKVLDKLMTDGLKVDGGNTIGKTIIFAKKHDHAEFIRKRFNANYPHHKDQFLKVIDYQVEYRHDLLNDFKTKNKLPQIACSVDMLDTGIDVPEVLNLVFLKPVKSRIKFWQMIGRGTRLSKNLFGFDDHKKEFLILDFCGNFEFFNQNPQGVESKRQASLSEKLFVFRLKLSQMLLVQEDEETKNLGVEHLDVLHSQVQNLYHLERDSFVLRPHLKLIEKYLDRDAWNKISQDELYEINTRIAPLVFDDEKDHTAKLFDLLTFELTSALINGESKQAVIIQRVTNISNKLQKKGSIPQVAQKMDLLKNVSAEDYWKEITPKGIENLRVEIRELIKFLDSESKKIVITNFEDQITSVRESAPVYESKSFDKEAYKAKIEQFVRENQYDLAIDKIRKNIKVTEGDLQHLETMLFEQGSQFSKDTFTEVYGERPLGEFIRSVVGVDRTEAKNAFARFTNDANFTLKQMEFVNAIIDNFAVNGIVQLHEFKEPKFTNIFGGGIISLFGPEKANEIRDVILEVNGNCVVM